MVSVFVIWMSTRSNFSNLLINISVFEWLMKSQKLRSGWPGAERIMGEKDTLIMKELLYCIGLGYATHSLSRPSSTPILFLF
jgi:hypothetical protein